jgi:hypothetical protein
MSQSAKISQSPFLDVTSFPAQESETVTEETQLSVLHQSDSPFSSVYELEDGEGRVDPESEEFIQFLNELHDEEFDEAVFELINEASALYEDRFLHDYRGPAIQTMEAERLLEEHFVPLESELEMLVETMAGDIDRRDLDTMTEAEIDAFIESYRPTRELSPNFENLWGWAKKKLKKAAKWAKKKAKALAKKAFRAALKRLKRYIKPWLKKLITFAINKLPKQYRPLAKMLAKKMGYQKEIEEEETFEEGQDTTGETGQFQQEFDLLFANLLFSEDETVQELMLTEVSSESQQPVTDPIADLDRAREQFVEGITKLEEGEDPAPLVENFIPAILPLVKLGLKFYGRPKLVNFIAKYVAKLIKRFVGRKYVRPLSRAIVDAGLRLINLEATEQEAMGAAGAAVASTVEDTVRQVAALPDYVLDDEELLEGFVLEAFEKSATRNLPEVLQEEAYIKRPDLRETKGLRGTWILQPLRGRKFYKKYTRVLNTKLSPHKLREIKTYAGVPLSEVLQAQYGLSPGTDLEVKAHLYEAIPGTMLSHISKYENSTPGLGTPAKYAYSQLHSLTPEAAGMLFGQPGLGQTISPRYLSNRRMMGVGQRVYYLEIPGLRLQIVPTSTAATTMRRCSETKLILDFARQQIRVYLFLSEPKAQEIALKIHQQMPIGVVMTSLKSIMEFGLKNVVFDGMHGQIKIIHQTITPQHSRSAAFLGIPQPVKENMVVRLVEWLGKGLSEFFRRQSQQFIAASQDPADGVTIAVTLENPPGFPLLRKALKGDKMSIRDMDFSGDIKEPHVQTVPGYYNE